MRLLDVLLPRRCAACAEPAAGWCDTCAAKAAQVALPDAGFTMLSPQVAAIGGYAYTGAVADTVRGLKLEGRWAAASPIGDALRRDLLLPDWPRTWVPSTRRRLRERGFEVPQLLAGSGAVCMVRRAVERADQTSLSAAQRRVSPVGAFSPVASVPPDVILVDDVRTTGATALAAADALRAGGARRVLVVTLAVGGDAARASSASATASRRG